MNEIDQVEILEGLVGHYSPTGYEAAAVQFLVERMSRMGFEARTDEIGNAVGSLGSGPREMILLGHIDTVPGEIPVRREGDLLWGRGTVDAKGPLACFAAAAALAGAAPGWRLTVIGALAEEGDSHGAKWVRDQYRPDFCIIGEPSGWEHVTLAYKGSAWFEFFISRSLAHSAAQSDSSCDSAAGFWNDFQARRSMYNQGKARVFEQLSASLRSMESGENGFSAWARLRFNLRLPPEISVAQVSSLLEELRGEGDLRLLDGVECYRAGKNTALVRSFLSAIRKSGGKPGFLLKTGTSDMNVVGPAWECPILAYGPGDSALDHTPDEHIQVPEYLNAVQVLATALKLLQV
jgi:[amino group carrier protein]-lysine/ornithine hydrolase